MNKNNASARISIIVASDNTDRLKAFLDMLEKTCHDPEAFEVLININSEQGSLKKYIEAQIIERSFYLHYIETDYDYFGLHKAYNQMLDQICPSSQMIAILSTNFIFESVHWDRLLLEKTPSFNHKIFCLRISQNKDRQYNTVRQAWDYCEHWGFYSREWLNVLKGWGDFWCPDATQEMVHFFLKKRYDISLSIPVSEIQVSRKKSHLNDHHHLGYIKKIIGEYYFYHKMLSYEGLRQIQKKTALMYLHASHPEAFFTIQKKSNAFEAIDPFGDVKQTVKIRGCFTTYLYIRIMSLRKILKLRMRFLAIQYSPCVYPIRHGLGQKVAKKVTKLYEVRSKIRPIMVSLR